MPRYGASHASKSSSSKSYKSESSSSSAKSSAPKWRKAPNAPEEFVVRFPNGVRRTFHSSDYETDEFQSEFRNIDGDKCNLWIGAATRSALYRGTDCYETQAFVRTLERFCDIVLDFDAEKGSVSTSSVSS